MIVARPEHGANFVLGHMRAHMPNTAWVDLAQRDDLDEIEQGNHFISAVNRDIGHPRLPPGLTLCNALTTFRRYARRKATTHLLVSGVPADSAFLANALRQDPAVLKVTAVCSEWEDREDVVTVTAAELALTEQEASRWPDTGLTPEELTQAWQASGGVLVPFLLACSDMAETLPPLIPGPEKPELLPGQGVEVPPELVFEALMHEERWTSALDLALAVLPERAIEVLEPAAHDHHQLGQQHRLYTIISELPEGDRSSLTALFWLLSSSLRLGKQEKHRQEIAACLARHEAPDLRALYAGTMLAYDQGIEEARRAYEMQRTPLTAFQYGRMLLDLPQSLEILHESVRLAEQSGRPYEVARNVEALATKLLKAGQYQSAEHWASYGLQTINKHNLMDKYRQLLLLNAWAFARLMLGKTAGLEDVLRTNTLGRESGLQVSARHLFRSTTADYLLATDRTTEALPIYEELLEEASRRERPQFLYGIARCLLSLGQREQAAQLVDQHLTLQEGADPTATYYGLIARALTRLDQQPRDAERDALTVFNDARAPMWTRLQASLTLAAIYLQQNDTLSAREALNKHQNVLSTLGHTGRSLLAPNHPPFDQVWGLIAHLDEDIEVRLLGSPARVYHKQQVVNVTPRMQEALAIILLSPNPVTLDQFMDAMGETERRPLQVLLSKLRALLPLSKAPLTLEAFYWCDAQQLLHACERHDPKAALELYRGPLLPFSDSPGVVEMREQIEEALRRCVIRHGDAEDVLGLAQKTHDDLELWETAQQRADPATPQADLIAARIQRLQSEYALN